ncbi:MAG: polyprenyl synthetase family protein [Bacteroidales bacterium]|nr:polyprenyl synthetase family protein [Bacteroidales bacterium]
MPAKSYDFVKEVLEDYNALAIKSLFRYIPEQEPRRYLYELVSSYPGRPGKGFRPGLCMATCKAFGGTEHLALQSAVAIELFHNAFLVHDDVEDDSDYRRGERTLNAEYGIPIAVNVGDAMNVLSIRPLMENLSLLGPELTWLVFTEVEHMVRQCVEGQAMELGWVHDNDIHLTEEDYLRMTLKKTCWYTIIHPCRIGALIATGGEADLDRFNRFGYYLGAAFQIQDDLLNLIGDKEKYGKEIGGDLWEGKRTMMLIHLLNSATDDEKEWLGHFLSVPRRQRNLQDVENVYRLMITYDSFGYARSCSRNLAGAALKEFFTAYGDLPDTRDKEFLYRIVLYMIEREL